MSSRATNAPLTGQGRWQGLPYKNPIRLAILRQQHDYGVGCGCVTIRQRRRELDRNNPLRLGGEVGLSRSEYGHEALGVGRKTAACSEEGFKLRPVDARQGGNHAC